MLKSAMKPQAAGTGAPATTEFSPTDLVNYQPKLGSVVELESDRTVDAILSNTFGPAVVMVYAPWCTHCHTMDEAFTKAAGLSHGVPFFKVQGVKCPVSSNKYGVTGYPTVFGTANVGGPPRRFMSARTPELLAEFAVGLKGSLPLAAAAQVTGSSGTELAGPVVSVATDASASIANSAGEASAIKFVPPTVELQS